MEIKVVFEDNRILVVEKPQGMLTQSDISESEDLLTILKKYIKEKYNKPGNVYLGLVHRLDRETGGVMVFARTSKSAASLSRQIRERSFKKNYLAVLEGTIDDKKGELRDFVLKDSNKNLVSIVDKETLNAQEAILEYEVLSEKEDLTLVKINLKTGRSHQIRVQFSNRGNPVLGDGKYGSLSKKEMALWSYKIAFNHPSLKKEVIFEVIPPKIYPWNLFSETLQTQLAIQK